MVGEGAGRMLVTDTLRSDWGGGEWGLMLVIGTLRSNWGGWGTGDHVGYRDATLKQQLGGLKTY